MFYLPVVTMLSNVARIDIFFHGKPSQLVRADWVDKIHESTFDDGWLLLPELGQERFERKSELVHGFAFNADNDVDIIPKLPQVAGFRVF